jgi:antagonist of KipI
MSISIIKKGLSDSIQDKGRYGYQHIGIQPNGCLDFISAWMGNKMLQNNMHHPVIELHFPSSQIQFEADHTICITGANFVPVINEKSVELYQPIQVKKNDILSMLQPLEGKICYIALKADFMDKTWLNSHSYNGDRFEKEQVIALNPISFNNWANSTTSNSFNTSPTENFNQLVLKNKAPIKFIPGPAWKHLKPEAIVALLNQSFSVSAQANRMGFNLQGPKLELQVPNAFLSSAVTRGTLQLLPNGSIIVLMADHQTIGGYANLGQIILVDLPRLAQMKTGSEFKFEITDLNKANQLYRNMYEQFQH